MGTHLNTIDSKEMAVQLTVYCEGNIEERGDALLMIADAWIFEVRALGLDPLKCLQTMLNSGSFH